VVTSDARRDLCFQLEAAPCALHLHDVRQEQLQRHAGFGGYVLCFVNRAHAAIGDMPNDPIPSGEDLIWFKHGGAASLRDESEPTTRVSVDQHAEASRRLCSRGPVQVRGHPVGRSFRATSRPITRRSLGFASCAGAATCEGTVSRPQNVSATRTLQVALMYVHHVVTRCHGRRAISHAKDDVRGHSFEALVRVSCERLAQLTCRRGRTSS
jgi:hypothetical protein